MSSEISLKTTSLIPCLLALTWIGSSADYVSITYDSCTNMIQCSSKESVEGECYIEYFEEDGVTNITLSLNSAIEPPSFLTLGATYRYNATITTNSEIVLLMLRSTFTVRESEECDMCRNDVEMRVTGENVSLIVVGLMVWIMSLIAAIIFIVVQLKFINENHIKSYRVSRVLGLCGIIVLVVAVPFWVAIGPVIATQTDLCELAWQQARTGIIACSFSLSVLSMILTCNSLVFLVYSYRHIIPLLKKHPSIIHREEIVMERRSTYSNPTGGEDFTNFTIKANPVYGFDLNTSSSESSKIEEEAPMDIVGHTNIKIEDAETDNKRKAAVVEECKDAEIIGNRFAS